MFKSGKKVLLLLAFISLFIILLSSCAAPIQRPSVLPKGDYSSLKTYMTQYITEQMNKYGVVGVSVALVDDQNVVWSEGFGYADKDKNIKVTPDTLFRVGSVSKTFTGLSVMQLAEKGLVDIDSPIQKYVPNFSIIDTFKDGGPITVKNIMYHHSGLPSDILKDWESNRPFEDVPVMFHDQYRAYPADYVFSYSNAGISMLGSLIQNVSGTKFEDYTQKNIFLPLNMKSSGFYLREDMKNNYSKSYKDGKAKEDMLIRDVPAGTVITSANDAVNYIKMYINGGIFDGKQIISKESLDKMWTVHNKNNELDFGMDLGLTWFINEDKTYGKFVSHGGDTTLFHAMLEINPEQKLGVIVMTNSENGALIAGSIAKEMIETACEIKTGNKKTVIEMKKYETVNVPLAETKKYEGYYAGGLGLVKLKASENKFDISFMGQNMELYKRTDGFYHPVMKFLWIFPLDIPQLDAVSFDFKNIKGEDMLLLNQIVEGKTYGMASKKIQPLNTDSVWFKRLGKYKAEDKGTMFDSIELKNVDGFIIAEITAEMQSGMTMIITPESDTVARVAGVGRNFNEAAQYFNENGKEYLYVSGIKFFKTK